MEIKNDKNVLSKLLKYPYLSNNTKLNFTVITFLMVP